LSLYSTGRIHPSFSVSAYVALTEKQLGKKVLNVFKDKGTKLIKEIANVVNKATSTVNEFWNNEVYGVDTKYYENDGFSIENHVGGEIIVAGKRQTIRLV
jgi:hypothetical protein